ncbi:ABC transporter permease [Oceanivirga salmonicida]|uniref:ABC transporter permease n=1 Tax=Oceanivirga salmonicida TaxID=1769291 RepID=UPI0008362742|nr:ABC transporter permease [Oceanivirga salmonicida]
MNNLVNAIFSADFVYSIFRLTTPILLAALAALITDRAGVMNIGLEGIMLSSALMGVIGSAYLKSAFLGLLCAIITGIIIAVIMAYFALNLDTNIILTGIAINLLASGGTVFLLYSVSGDKGISASLASLTLPTVRIPIIDSIPVLGRMLSNHNVLTYVSLILVLVIWLVLYRTSLGLRIRIVGENPDAAKSVGINVIKIKYYALLISGFLASLGGAYMSMGYIDKFARDMTAGRGFIALAAEALGRGTPFGTLISSIIFGTADALASNLQILSIPAQFIQMIPYIFTIVGLIVYSISKNNKIKLLKLGNDKNEEEK